MTVPWMPENGASSGQGWGAAGSRQTRPCPADGPVSWPALRAGWRRSGPTLGPGPLTLWQGGRVLACVVSVTASP